MWKEGRIDVGWAIRTALGLSPGDPLNLPLCPGTFDSKFAFVNTTGLAKKIAPLDKVP